MKTPKVISDVEQQAARQLNALMRSVRQQYKRLVSGGTTSTAAAQRKFIRSLEKTIDSAEDIIAEMKPRIAAVKRSLGGTRRKKVKRVKSAARRKAPTRRKAATKRAVKARKKKL